MGSISLQTTASSKINFQQDSISLDDFKEKYGSELDTLIDSNTFDIKPDRIMDTKTFQEFIEDFQKLDLENVEPYEKLRVKDWYDSLHFQNTADWRIFLTNTFSHIETHTDASFIMLIFELYCYLMFKVTNTLVWSQIRAVTKADLVLLKINYLSLPSKLGGGSLL